MTGPAIDGVPEQRSIIDRRALAASIDQGGNVSAVLAEGLAAGRAEIARRLAEEPGHGRQAARAIAFLHDQLVRLAFDHASESVPGADGEVVLVGLGGTGRGEMAPSSDVDLMFLTEEAPTAEHERIAEAVLHLLWDLK